MQASLKGADLPLPSAKSKVFGDTFKKTGLTTLSRMGAGLASPSVASLRYWSSLLLALVLVELQNTRKKASWPLF